MRPGPEKKRLENQLRKQRLDEARARATHTEAEWQALMKEFDFRCVRCGTDDFQVERDHVIPLYMPNATDGIDNIQPLCPTCNRGKVDSTMNWVVFRRTNGWR